MLHTSPLSAILRTSACTSWGREGARGQQRGSHRTDCSPAYDVFQLRLTLGPRGSRQHLGEVKDFPRGVLLAVSVPPPELTCDVGHIVYVDNCVVARMVQGVAAARLRAAQVTPEEARLPIRDVEEESPSMVC